MEIKKFKVFEDERGDLTPIEFSDLPFIPQRIFIVKNCEKGIKRGGHAHHKTQQLLICLKGSIKAVTHDGVIESTGILNEGDTAFIDTYQWDYQEFLTGNDVLLVLCSTPFNIDDYILNYEDFLRIARERND